MRHRNSYLLSVFSFIIGCMLSMSIFNYDSCDFKHESLVKHRSEVSMNKVAPYVGLILSNPENFDRRKTIRNTWLKLKSFLAPSISPLAQENVVENKEFEHYFVVGVSSVSDKIRALLRNEQQEHGDLLILPQLKDRYTTLSDKLIQSIRWIHLNYPNLLYLLKCDDDSFVRIDKLIQELRSIRKTALESSKGSVMYSASDGKFQKEQGEAVTGLYWGYFKGTAQVQRAGRWAESDFFLCDRYLPYALGGGYVISADILEFIAKNSHYLQLYKSEDVSMGVWTAPLSRVRRLHDVRFDTEWSSRGCNDSYLIRHKQGIRDMEDSYFTLTQSQNTRLCQIISVLRLPYQYNWAVPPSQCCKITD